MLESILGITSNEIHSISVHAFFIVFLCFLIYKLAIYPFYISSLRNVPGPYLHRISILPSLYAQWTSKWNRRIHQLHQTYGNVVLLSPKGVSCNGDSKFITDIYVKNMPKSSYYENFKFHGKINMFAELDNEKHLHFRKMISSIYNKSAVFSAKNETRKNIVDNVKTLVNQVFLTSVTAEHDRPEVAREDTESASSRRPKVHDSKNHGSPIEVHSLFGALAMDVVSAFELGVGNGTNLLDNSDQREILKMHRMLSEMTFWLTRLPQLWAWVAGKETIKAAQTIEKWQLGLYDKAEDKITLKPNDEANLSTLETLKRNGLTGPYAYSNVSDNLVAGHDTTSIQLTYLCYELSRPVNSSYQIRLRNELKEAFGEPPNSLEASIDNFETVDGLPLLDALIQENLRIHASTPGPEYRLTDKVYEVEIGGKGVHIPPGVEISCLPYLMHRVERVFTEPEKWSPERWLQHKDESKGEYTSRTREMQRYMMPFGKGVRGCIGLHIAWIEIKLAIANLYWRYSLEVSPEWCEVISSRESGEIRTGTEFATLNTDESLMAKTDAYISRPVHDECWLQWTEV